MAHRVTQAAAARLLLDPGARRVLSALVGRERTLSDLAQELQVPLNSLLYRVRALIQAELVLIAREERRAGRAVKWYRAVADSYFVPFQQAPAETAQGLSRQDWEQRRDGFLHSMTEAATAYLEAWGLREWGLRFDLDRQGRLVMQHAVDGETAPDLLDRRSPAFLDIWVDDLALTFDEAKTLQRELTDVYRKYRRQGGGQRYLMRLALAPRVEK